MTFETREDATFLAQQVASGAVSPDELLDDAVARVTALNPHLNAVVLVQENIARQAIKAGLPDGPFKGVPFLLKAIIADFAVDVAWNAIHMHAPRRNIGSNYFACHSLCLPVIPSRFQKIKITGVKQSP